MTSAEFVTFRTRLVREYAAKHVRAGNWTHEEAPLRASKQTDELLPQGIDTVGMLLLCAETVDGDVVGQVWVALQHRPGSGGGAWIYDIEVAPEHRGRGYGRALLRAAERGTARHGVTAIGPNVFGPNTAARSLYESAGYEVMSVQMRKEIR